MKTSKHRLILPLQAKGNMGKSIESTTRACWLDQLGIHWQGFDLDGDNQTFSRLFPDQVKLMPMAGRPEDQDDIMRILKQVTNAPVTMLDPRAHLGSLLMQSLKASHFFEIASRSSIAITVVLYPMDDLEVMDNLDQIYRFCTDEVDYLIIRNSLRAPRTRMFDGSPLEEDLKALGAQQISLPILGDFVKFKLSRLEAQLQRGIPFHQAVSDDTLGLEIMARGVLQDWLAKMYRQYDQVASILLPTELAAEHKTKSFPAMDGQSPAPNHGRGARAVLED